MKVKDIPILKQRVLDAMPITQAEVAKMLGIDRRDTSRLIAVMLKEHIIKRTKADNTFLLEKNGSDVREKKKDLGALLSGEKFSPCCGCELVCDPAHCQKLTEWVMGYIKLDKEQKDELLSLDGEDKKLEDEKSKKNGDKK